MAKPLNEDVCFKNEIPEDPFFLDSNTVIKSECVWFKLELDEEETESREPLDKDESPKAPISLEIQVDEEHSLNCKRCNIRFETRQERRIHSITCRKLFSEYKCTECEEVYYSMENFRIHKNMHAGIEEKLICDICGTNISHMQSLQEHMAIHTGDNAFTCPTCGRNKAFSCDLCGKKFRTGNELGRHEPIHEEKPYVCEVCKKHFRERASLENHVRCHTGEKQYCCMICSKNYGSENSLRKHICIWPV